MVTTRCPMICPHCLADAGTSGRDMSDEVFGAALDGVANNRVEELLLTGGEPLARGDLPKLVEDLGTRGISWSLNTAWSPDATQRRAIERHPPGFVAVSLDGPAAVHDAFRGVDGAHRRALDAIRWFSSLDGCTVTAGTTVTRRNLRHLDRTLHEVAASGAEAWGLHLLVPEGRAEGRNDLALRRRDLDGILRFTARRRSVFPVSMADELGYCGEWEPMVRDLPLGCGAGRAMCVVLPDGEVVPCTTMDRGASAGNVLDRPLMEIWAEGFQELRSWSPEGRCEGCDYAPACQGGCWLQRRRGEQCFKDVWQIPGALKTAASVAVCLGMLGSSATATTDDSPRHPERSAAQPKDLKAGATLESRILRWYGDQLPSRGDHSRYPIQEIEQKPDLATPGPLGFVSMVRSDSLPAEPGERLSLVNHMAGTDHGSLAFDALLLRVTTEAALTGPLPEDRTPDLDGALSAALRTIRDKAGALRLKIFDEKLDPYLQRGRLHLRHRFEMSKAYRPPPGWLKLERDTAEERWGTPNSGPSRDQARRAQEATRTPQTAEITKDYLDRHPWGEHLAVSFRTRRGFPEASDPGADKFKRFGPFDTLQVPKSVEDPSKLEERSRANDLPLPVVEVRLQGTLKPLTVTLPPGVTITWPDLLRTAWTQHRDILTERLDALDSMDLDTPRDPLLLPAVMDQLREGVAERGRPVGDLQTWLADFWLF